MNKKGVFILMIPVFIGCLSIVDSMNELDLGPFKISVPTNWNYKKEQGEDSFIGKVVGPDVSLQFDYSSLGYANSLLPTEQDYLKKREWEQDGYFYKSGITYTADFNVKNEKAAQMKKLGTNDSTLVHVEADPSYHTKTNINLPSSSQKIKFPQADYIADLTFKDSTVYVPITIPPEIKSHYIHVDTTKKYIIKTIWPKIPSKGMTGIYFKGRFSNLTFNMVGFNLSKKNQDIALKAFKTIVIK